MKKMPDEIGFVGKEFDYNGMECRSLYGGGNYYIRFANSETVVASVMVLCDYVFVNNTITGGLMFKSPLEDLPGYRPRDYQYMLEFCVDKIIKLL